MNFVFTEFKSITRVLAMVVQVKRRIHVTEEESEQSEHEEVNKSSCFSSSSNVLVEDACFHMDLLHA